MEKGVLLEVVSDLKMARVIEIGDVDGILGLKEQIDSDIKEFTKMISSLDDNELEFLGDEGGNYEAVNSKVIKTPEYHILVIEEKFIAKLEKLKEENHFCNCVYNYISDISFIIKEHESLQG